MHNLDITNGEASFVSARQDAWHQLGVVLPDTFTAEEAMTHGHLGGWDVRKVPVVAMTDAGALPVPGKHAVIRNNSVVKGQIDPLGIVGDNHVAIQNEEHTEFLNTLVEESGAHFDTAGAIDGGRRVFVTMEMPGHIKIGGVDQVKNYIAAINSHDGSMAFTFMVTPVRIVCENTLNMAFNASSHMFRVRHTRGAKTLLVQQAREALEVTFNYLEGFQEEAERLINTTLTQQRFEALIEANFGAPEDAGKAAVTRAEKRLDQMTNLFADAMTQEGIRGTAWAGLNALTEWADHYAPARGDDHDASRATRALLNPSFKNDALALMLAEVK